MDDIEAAAREIIFDYFERAKSFLTGEYETFGPPDPEGLETVVYIWTEYNDPIRDKNYEAPDYDHLCEQGIAIALERAKESADAFDYCKNLAAENLGKSDLLDNFAKAILKDELLRPKAKRGRKSNTGMRNARIVMAVRAAVRCGLPEYWNGEDNKETACSLVESILISKFGIACDVTSIWKNHKSKNTN